MLYFFAVSALRDAWHSCFRDWLFLVFSYPHRLCHPFVISWLYALRLHKPLRFHLLLYFSSWKSLTNIKRTWASRCSSRTRYAKNGICSSQMIDSKCSYRRWAFWTMQDKIKASRLHVKEVSQNSSKGCGEKSSIVYSHLNKYVQEFILHFVHKIVGTSETPLPVLIQILALWTGLGDHQGVGLCLRLLTKHAPQRNVWIEWSICVDSFGYNSTLLHPREVSKSIGFGNALSRVQLTIRRSCCDNFRMVFWLHNSSIF